MNGRRLILAVLLTFVAVAAFSQDEPKKGKVAVRPNIPGNFIVDFSFNFGVNKPADFKKGFFGSRAINLYYYYPLRFGQSKLSFNPGIGFSLERYKFTNFYLLLDTLQNMSTLAPNTIYPGIKKSRFITNYFEIPVEFRLDTNPDDIARTFWVALGARVGTLLNASTKVKYKEDSQNKILKDRQRYGLNRFRLAASLRVGIGAFNWFAYYNLTPLFDKGRGPDQTTMNTWTLGISINGL